MEIKSRGYYKIKGAANAFNFDFRNKVVLDIGSSTGGFTQYALERGAKQVIAIEKGTNQMVSPLRNDPRIVLYEKTDIFNVKVARKGATSSIQPKTTDSDGSIKLNLLLLSRFPDVIVADVSFISLTSVLIHVQKHLASPDTDLIVMLKPQFEAKPYQLNSGVIKNEKIRREIIKNFEHWLKTHRFVIVNKRDNALHGKTGNLERFYWLKAK